MPIPASSAERSSSFSGRAAWWLVLHAQQFSSSIGTQEWPPMGWSPRGGIRVKLGMIHWVMRQ